MEVTYLENECGKKGQEARSMFRERERSPSDGNWRTREKVLGYPLIIYICVVENA